MKSTDNKFPCGCSGTDSRCPWHTGEAAMKPQKMETSDRWFAVVRLINEAENLMRSVGNDPEILCHSDVWIGIADKLKLISDGMLSGETE